MALKEITFSIRTKLIGYSGSIAKLQEQLEDKDHDFYLDFCKIIVEYFDNLYFVDDEGMEVESIVESIKDMKLIPDDNP